MSMCRVFIGENARIGKNISNANTRAEYYIPSGSRTKLLRKKRFVLYCYVYIR